MGLSLLGATIGGGLYKAPVPSQAIKDTYHFRHLLHRFASHVTKGEKLTKREEECLKKLGSDCCAYLNMKAHSCSSYMQVVATLTNILKKTGMPQVSGKNKTNSMKYSSRASQRFLCCTWRYYVLGSYIRLSTHMSPLPYECPSKCHHSREHNISVTL